LPGHDDPLLKFELGQGARWSATGLRVAVYVAVVRRPQQFAGLAACLIAGVLAATALGGVTITTETTTETVSEPTTVLTTATVEQTTTRRIIAPTSSTSTSSTSSSSSETPAWVWVLLAILAAALVILIILLARRGGGSSVSPEERRRRLDGAVASWTTQGWAVESQSADSAILRRAGERMNVSVDSAGQVFTQPLSAGPPT
jgi:hypothetical protein